MQNIKLIIAYDGGAYLGWQKTQEGPSIEAALQATLEQILQHPIHLQAASRTDAGVHAQGQVVNFVVAKEPFDLHRLHTSLNSLLPKDIVVLSSEAAPPQFHPTLDSTSKEYRYYLCLGPVQLPQHRRYSWHEHHPLDIEKMHAAATALIGKHDFSAFCNFKKNAHYQDFVREVHNIEILPLDGHRLCIRVEGSHFLYKMVRNIVGTLVYIGRGKIPLEELPQLLASQDRTKLGVTAPAHGLFLHQISY